MDKIDKALEADTMKNVRVNLRKVRSYRSGTNIFFLLRNMDGTQSLVTLPIRSPVTLMMKRNIVKL